MKIGSTQFFCKFCESEWIASTHQEECEVCGSKEVERIERRPTKTLDQVLDDLSEEEC